MASDLFEAERHHMVESQLMPRGIFDARLLAAMRQVPRHRFVPAEMRSRAYEDTPLPIGEGQTISQPYIVALMVQSCCLQGGERVLEVGTGSGYGAAVLGRLAGQVYTVERVDVLAKRAEKAILELGYDNVFCYSGDGSLGLSDQGPYDAIVVTAAAPDLPQSLKEQLAIGGRLVIPVGGQLAQNLFVITRLAEEAYDMRQIEGVRFVPLIGKEGWQKP